MLMADVSIDSACEEINHNVTYRTVFIITRKLSLAIICPLYLKTTRLMLQRFGCLASSTH